VVSLSPPIDIDAQAAAENAELRRPLPLILKRSLREPLLHFLLLGLALFAVYGYMHRGRGGVESSKQILLTMDDLRQMNVYFESQWHRPPTQQEFEGMVEDKVHEEVLYREGLAMGLDKDDTIVKRRMAQRIQFLAEDVAAAHEPSTAEHKTWYEKNTDKFALPSRISFRHLYFSPDKRRGLARRSVHVSGLLRRPHSRSHLQGVRSPIAVVLEKAEPRRLARPRRIQLRLAPCLC
jgi:hypothetical protein